MSLRKLKYKKQFSRSVSSFKQSND